MAKFRLLSVLLSKWPKVQIKHRLLSNLAMYCYSPLGSKTNNLIVLVQGGSLGNDVFALWVLVKSTEKEIIILIKSRSEESNLKYLSCNTQGFVGLVARSMSANHWLKPHSH